MTTDNFHIWKHRDTICHPEHSIHIWLGDLVLLSHHLETLRNMLPPEELVRFKRSPIETVRRRQVMTRGLLRFLLGKYLNQAPETLEFNKGKYGKPFLLQKNYARTLHFNLSHSQDLVLYAFSGHPFLGIDCECLDGHRIRDWSSIADRVFTREERTELFGFPESERQDAFFRGWTRKEAYTKAIGDGFQYDFETFSVSLDCKSVPKIIHDRNDPGAPESWQLFDIPLDKPALGTLCVKKSEYTPQLHFYQIHEGLFTNTS